MRLVLDPRAWRLLRRLPRYSVYSVLEIVLLSLLAIQCARLLWAVATPVDPLGDWRLPSLVAGTEQSRLALLRGFDPFFRLSQGQSEAVVTSLQLNLYGVRVNEATGQGSAIIAGPDDVQTSYAVGDEILPGVTLKSVTFDSVVILRGAAEETLFLDQSTPAPVAEPTPAEATDTMLDSQPTPAGQSVTPAQIQSDIRFMPRTDNGRVTGFVVRPNGSGAAFRTAGFRDGDIVVGINGQPVSSAAQLQQAAAGLAGGGNLAVSVERGSDIVPIAITVSGR